MSLEFIVTWNGPAIAREVTGGAVRGLNQAAAHLQSKTVQRTPKDTGELRRSLVIFPATIQSPRSGVGSNLHYAIRQHEELSYRHKFGEAKFLERAMNAEARSLQSIIANNLGRG